MINENLKLGDVGDNVKILQEKLKILGFYNAIITGSFGLSTQEGVKVFQKKYGLEENGIVNNETWYELFNLTSSKYSTISVFPILRLGDSGEAVNDLQTKLSTLLYYTGQINSNFDLETENAVKRFQLHNDLTANGVVDNQTWNLINSSYSNLNSCIIGSIENDNYSTYIVKKGDTLYAIAKKYGVTVDEIKNLNNLTNNIISVGQSLKIPAYIDNNYTTYIVKSGDRVFMGNNEYMRIKIDSF